MKADLRILLKYYYTNTHRFKFIGTTNRTEYYLARALGRCLGVLRNIIEKPVSIRLWIGQETEKAFGLLYDSLDLRIASEIGVDQLSADRIIARIAANEHKRLPPAILRLS